MALTTYEKMLDEATETGISIDEKKLRADDVYDGLCFCGYPSTGDVIVINGHRTTCEKTAALAEELGHYHKSVGDIIDQSSVASRKSENAGRAWAYRKLCAPERIRELMRDGWFSFEEIAEELNVPPEFLLDAMAHYQRKGISLNTYEPTQPEEAVASGRSINDLPPERKAALMKLLQDSSVGALPKFLSKVCHGQQEEAD